MRKKREFLLGLFALQDRVFGATIFPIKENFAKRKAKYMFISKEWQEVLPQETTELAQKLADRAATERAKGAVVFPPQADIFRALTLTPPEKVSCCIVGQDPYGTVGFANGLAFSVNKGITIPRSLKNILKELQADVGCDIPTHGDLTAWAEQGVLMLNTVLTVEEGKPNSHAKWGWQVVTLDIVKACMQLPQPVVLVLWGGQARAFSEDLRAEFVGSNKKWICSSHPSPLGATKGSATVPAFIGSRPFSTVNSLLKEMGGKGIDWTLC